MTYKLKQQGLALRNSKGFTIVELLIVIVVIGILAALVITTFTGIQRKARDTERTTDIKAIHSQLEAYYAQNGWYPALAEVNTTTLAGLDADALVAPNSSTAIDSTASTTAKYSYVPSPSTCTTAAADCVSYTLEALLESGSKFTKNSLN